MPPIPFYRCGKCKREHPSYDAATGCEDGHLIPIAVETKSYTIKPYPYSVEITFTNGEKKIYNAEDLGG